MSLPGFALKTGIPLWKRLVCLALLAAESGVCLWPQTTGTNQTAISQNPTTSAVTPSTTGKSVFFDTSGFPQWAKDLHRAEVVAFGAIPFALLFTAIGFDTYRYFSHGGDSGYAPWPFKPAGAVERTNDEQIAVISIAAGTVAAVALADFIIEKVKRYKKEKAARQLPKGTPIIIRKPLQQKEEESAPAEAP